MITEIDTAIKKLVDKSSSTSASDEALRFSQSALNLIHVKNIEAEIKRQEVKI